MADIVEYLIKLKDEFSEKAEKISKKIEKIEGNSSKLDRALSHLADKFTHIGKGLSIGVTAPILAMAWASLHAAGKIEDLSVSFEGLLGSKEKANELVETLEKFSNTKANVSLESISVAARSLLTAGVPVDQLTKQLQSLGDVAAGSGKTTMEALSQLSSRVDVRGFATSRDILQLQVQGVNIKKGLAAMFHLDPTSVTDSLKLRKIMEAGGVSAKAFNAALMGLSATGGPFSGAMLAKMNTMNGSFQLLGKAIEHVFLQTGNFLKDTLKFPAALNKLSFALIAATDKLKAWAEIHPVRAEWILTFLGMAAALGPVLLALAAVAKAIIVVGSALRFVFATNPWVISLTALIALIILIVKHWDTVKKAILSMAHTAVNEIHKIENAIIRLINKLNIFHQMKLKEVDPNGSERLTKAKQGTMIGSDFVPFVPSPAAAKSKVDVNVNINDKNENVKSVSTKSDGNAKFNVGTNMTGTAAAMGAY